MHHAWEQRYRNIACLNQMESLCRGKEINPGNLCHIQFACWWSDAPSLGNNLGMDVYPVWQWQKHMCNSRLSRNVVILPMSSFPEAMRHNYFITFVFRYLLGLLLVCPRLPVNTMWFMQNCSRNCSTPKAQFSLYLTVVCLMQKMSTKAMKNESVL